jgi:hypothetical protein
MSVNTATAASRSSNASTRLPVLSKIEYVISTREYRHGLPVYVPLMAACSTAGSPHTDQCRGPPVLAVQTPKPGTKRNSATWSPDAASGPVDQRPAWLRGLEHRNGHVDDRSPDLGSSWQPLKLVVGAEAVELRRIVFGPGRSVQPHLVFENVDMDFLDDRHARHRSRNHRRRFGIPRRASAECVWLRPQPQPEQHY